MSDERPAAENVSAEEIARFGALANRWWDPNGPQRPLPELNPARRLAQRQRPANRNIEMRQHVLRQDDTGGIADLLDLERRVHTGVITERPRIRKAAPSAP